MHRRTTMKLGLAVLAGAAGLAASYPVAAQQYPNKPIRFIVPY